jgi:predicted nucleic acid-binding OB-fold protein
MKLIVYDPTIEELSFDASDSESKAKIEMIETRIKYESLTVHENNIEILDCLSDYLENAELKEFVLILLEKAEPLTISNYTIQLTFQKSPT